MKDRPDVSRNSGINYRLPKSPRKFASSFILLMVAFVFLALPLAAQTSWKGTTSTVWSNASNWTNGVPGATSDVIIGDVNFVGPYQPGTTSASRCRSLSIGIGLKVCTLNIDKAISIEGDLTIGVNGTINHSNSTISLKGNWVKNGTYNASNTNSYVIFSGVTQTLSGTTAFKKLTVNAGSTLTLNANISVAKALAVNGVLDPGSAYLVTIANQSLSVNSGGVIKVRASTYSGNYSGTPLLNAGSVVDYTSSSIDQVIAVYNYSTLRVSGTKTKTLANNVTLISYSGGVGNLEILSGTLDLGLRTLSRGTTVSGGSITIANGAALKIGGTNSYPSNYATSNLATTSTVEYNGANQSVSNQPYGNLTLSSAGGSCTKTMPSTAMVVANNFTSSVGSGTSVSYTAGNNISVAGDFTIGSSTTFNGLAYYHTISGNWINNGTFSGGSSTINLDGTNKAITGTSLTSFYNLTASGFGISSALTSITVSGNLSTIGAGTIEHTAGTMTLSGGSKIISGTGITLNNLTVSGTITTTTSFLIAGNLLVSGTLNATAGTMEFNGTAKTISGSGTISLSGVRITGTISTAISLAIKSDLMGLGKLTANAGTITLSGSTTYAGTHDLFNVVLNGSKLQLGANSTLGIAGTLVLTAGVFDVTTTAPNTVNYNSTGSQSVLATTYNNLSLSNGGTKTAAGIISLNNLSIGAATTFNASTYTHTISGNWTNSGSFVPGTSTVQFIGNKDAMITGATTFNTITINKASAANYLSMVNNVSAATLNMTSGDLHTGNNTITITNTRNGNGIITGTITRTHPFSVGVPYLFEGPYNSITLTAIVGSISSVTVSVYPSSSELIPMEGSVSRVYAINVTNTGTYVATLRLNYLHEELDGNVESLLDLWQFVGSWTKIGKTANDAANDWVEKTSLTDISGHWTLSNDNTVGIWKGSISAAWETAGNWKAGVVPASDGIVHIGFETFTNQPVISTATTVKAITFGSAQPVTLTLVNGGALTTGGTIQGTWSSNASHSINAGAQSLHVGGDFILGAGNSSQVINMSIGTGSVSVSGSLVQSSGANVTFGGSGNLSVGNNYNYSGGTFTGGSGTVTYIGGSSQTVAPVNYNNLIFDKTSGGAAISSPLTVTGNLILSTGGTLNINSDVTVSGNMVIGNGVTVNEGGTILSVGGDWTKSGTFNATTGTVILNGSGNQIISPTTFNKLTIDKPGGFTTLSGNIVINGNLTLTKGTLDLGTFTANRSIVGGMLSLSSGTILRLGASNFPANYNVKSISAGSIVEYNGVVAQNIVAMTYGSLNITNGSLAKSLTGMTTVLGDLTISSGAVLNGGANTLTLKGNLSNNGSFIPSTGTMILQGTNNLITGTTTLNNLIVLGSYSSAPDTDLIIEGNAEVSGTYISGTNDITIAGNLLISGTYSSDGISRYTGTRLQTVRLTGSFLSPLGLTQTIFDGSVAPILNSAIPPVFMNVRIQNTSGIRPSVDWTVMREFYVAPGCTFAGGSLTHKFYGDIDNEGSISSSGVLNICPATPYTTTSSVTLKLGTESSFVSTGSTIFGGSSEIIFDDAPMSFYDVDITNTNTAGITPSSNWSITGNLIVQTGAIFNAGDSLTHSLRRDLDVDGTFNGGTSTVILDPLDSVNYISASGSLTFNNLTIAGTVSALSDFNIEQNLVNNGTLDVSEITMAFTGNTASVISGSTNPMALQYLTIDKINSSVTTTVDLSDVTNLLIIRGVFADAGKVISSNAAGVLAIQEGGTLKIESVNSLPVFPAYVFDPLSLVEYSGTDQIIAPQTYGALTANNAGNKTLAEGITQISTLTNNSTLLHAVNSELKVQGDWVNNGLYTPGEIAVEFNGTESQNIRGSAVINFKNLTISNTANPGVSIESNQNLTGVLTLGSDVQFDADGVNNDKIFTLISSADDLTTDASVAVLPTGAQVTGKVTIQRFMSKEGANSARIYRYIAAPIQNATVADIQNEITVTGSFVGTSICSGCGTSQSMFTYNESITKDTNGNGTVDSNDRYVDFPADSNTEVLIPGKGYSIFVRGNSLNATAWDVRGVINSGNQTPVTFPVSFSSSANGSVDGWNLIGNPFPAAIDWDATSGWTKTNMEQSIYTRNNGLAYPNFAVWNGTLGINGGSNYIAMGQAFWVRASGMGTPVLQANENVKAAGTQTTFFRSAAIQNLLRITMVKGAIKDETAIHFTEGATAGFDSNIDARKMAGSSFNLTTVINDGTKLAINSLPELNCSASVRLAIDNAAVGNYKFDFSDLQTFDPLVTITLVDKFTQQSVDIRNGSYDFAVTSNASSYGSNRFEIRFNVPAPSSDFMLESAAICEGVDAIVKIDKTQLSVSYSCFQNDVLIAGPATGNGSVLALIIPKKKLRAGENSLKIQASKIGCDVTVDKTIQIHVEQNYSLTANGNAMRCGAGSLTLSVTGAPLSATYNWYDAPSATLPLPDQHNQTFVTPDLNTTTTYYVAAINAMGCEGSRESVVANIIESVDPVISSSGTTLMSSYVDGNQWYYNDEIIVGANHQTLEATKSGLYRVQTTQDLCTGSAEQMFQITGLEQNIESVLQIYPNPTSGIVHVKISGDEDRNPVLLLDIMGQVLETQETKVMDDNRICEFSLAELPVGIYIIECSRFGNKVRTKIIKH